MVFGLICPIAECFWELIGVGILAELILSALIRQLNNCGAGDKPYNSLYPTNSDQCY